MRSTILVLVFSVACFLRGQAQNPSAQQQQPTFSPSAGMATTMEDPALPPNMTHEMVKRQAQEREAQLRTDTDKLLKLSEELKTYVDKSNQNILSLDVVRKADEIEKLAKSVKDKMKGPN